jgi:hypothetical protein
MKFSRGAPALAPAVALRWVNPEQLERLIDLQFFSEAFGGV